MIQFWLSTILIFIFQEQASTNALLLYAKQHQIAHWPIHILWILLSVFDIAVAYALGQWVHKKVAPSKIGARLDGYARKIEATLGSRNESIALTLLGIVNFPYINAFLCSWLKLDFKQILLYLLIGNTISYIITWETVIWFNRLIPNPLWALLAIILFSFFISIIFRLTLRQRIKK